MAFQKEEWDLSYERMDNFTFYPKEEIVRFLNRYVRKRIGLNKFKDLVDFSCPVQALDFGCGIGRQTLLLEDFGLKSWGVDISAKAISFAKELATSAGNKALADRFLILDGERLPFLDRQFDVIISEGVLDSMPFAMAQQFMKELLRVSNRFFYFSVISGDNQDFYKEYNDEVVVTNRHEEGTVQSYFNWEKIQRLIAGLDFQVIFCRLVTETSVISQYRYGRYYVILKRN